MSKSNKNRIVLLCGDSLHNLSTAATIISADLHVVGICICNQRTMGLPIKRLLRSVKKKGAVKLVGQVLGRMYYNALNSRKDRAIYQRLFPEKHILNVVSHWSGKIHRTENYEHHDTLSWLKSLDADIFLVHSGYFVNKTVREIPKKKIVIGGHPGLIPTYRGSHSPFWAIFGGKPQDVGCSLFWLDESIDAGNLIWQERIAIDSEDSFVTLGWKGMVKQAETMAKLITRFDEGQTLANQKHNKIPENSLYDTPTLVEYLNYRKKQKDTR